MKIEETELVIKVRSFKSGKYIKLLLVDSLEDFQNSVSPLIPKIMKSLRRNNGYESLEMLQKYQNYLQQMDEILQQTIDLVESNIIPYMGRGKGESGTTITVDGTVNYTIQPGDSVILGENKSSADTEVLEDLSDLEEDSLGVDGGSE